jgi:hypothetical protein
VFIYDAEFLYFISEDRNVATGIGTFTLGYEIEYVTGMEN